MFLLGARCLAGARGARPPARPSLAKVLVVGTDGTRWDLVRRPRCSRPCPNLARLGREGVARPVAARRTPRRGALTISEVGWSSIASGVGPDKRGVNGSKLNMDPGQATKNGYRDFLTRVETGTVRVRAPTWPATGPTAAAPKTAGRSSGPASTRAHVAGGQGDLAAYNRGDAEVTEDADRYLRRGDPDASFVYLGAVDETAHLAGSARPPTRLPSPPPMGAIGRLIRAVRSLPELSVRELDDPRDHRPRAKGALPSRRRSATSARHRSRSPRS